MEMLIIIAAILIVVFMMYWTYEIMCTGRHHSKQLREILEELKKKNQ